MAPQTRRVRRDSSEASPAARARARSLPPQDADVVFAQSLAAIRALAEDPATLGADGVATFCELSVPVVARLSEELGLPGHTPAAVDRARDKHRTREEMARAGLPVPRRALHSASLPAFRGTSEVVTHTGGLCRLRA